MSPTTDLSGGQSPLPGDRELFIRLYVRHQRQLHAFVSSMLAAPADVEEVLQETSIVLWSKFDSFRQDESFLNWACGVAHLEVLRFYRTNRRRLLPLEESVLEQLMAERLEQTTRLDERRSALADCLAALRARDRKLIERCYEPGVSFKEVAEDLGRPVNAVYKSLGRVRRALYECINRTIAAEGRQ